MQEPTAMYSIIFVYSIIFSEEHALWKFPKHWCWWVLELNRERRWDPLIWQRTVCLFTSPQINCQEDQLTPGSNPHSKIYSYNKGSCPVNSVMVSYPFTNVIQVHRSFDSSKVHSDLETLRLKFLCNHQERNKIEFSFSSGVLKEIEIHWREFLALEKLQGLMLVISSIKHNIIYLFVYSSIHLLHAFTRHLECFDRTTVSLIKLWDTWQCPWEM